MNNTAPKPALPLDADARLQSSSRRDVLRHAAALPLATLPLGNLAHAQGRKIKVGYITALSGVRANFGEADQWTVERVRAAIKSGAALGGKKLDIEILVKDNQSDLNRSIAVGNELLLRDKVDLLLIQDTDAAVALGELCDLHGVPTISTMGPWQSWVFGRKSTPDKGFPFTFHFFWGAEDVYKNFTGMWNSVRSSKTVGTLYIDNYVGQAFADPVHGMPGALKQANFKEVPGGLFKMQTDDFSSQISAFKAGKADIVTGFAYANHWSTFWNQAAQQGFQPEICTMAAAFLFPSALNALGARGDGMSTEVWWSPSFPFKSSLTGQSARELAADWEKSTGKQWTQPLGYGHALWEVGLAALRSAADPKDRKSLRDAIAALQLETVVGPVKFAGSPIKNVAVTQLVGGQWRKTKAGSKFPFELLVVHNGTAKTIPTDAEFKLLSKLA